jgi:hypothetical protein
MTPNIHTIIRQHVSLEVRCIDRVYLHAYMPKLQTSGGLCYFLHDHLGYPVPSPALLKPRHDRFIAAVQEFAAAQRLEVVPFERGESKDERVAKDRARFTAHEGVVFIGVAQEKMRSFKAHRRQGQGRTPVFDFSRQSVAVNHYYFYVHDQDWGPAFLKIGTYLPYPVKLCLNGHEWVKQRLRRDRIRFESLDNGFLSCADPAALQAACNALGPVDVQAFFDRWSHRLPWPMTVAERAAGYDHRLAICQLEVSYFKEQHALRTETTINNPMDFYVRKGLENLSYLRELGHQVNRKLLEVERVSHHCVLTQEALDRLQRPTVEDGQRVSAVRFGDPRVMALFQALCAFTHLPRGFRNHDLRPAVAALLGRPYTAAQMTYDLRRLRLKGLIHRIPNTHRYTATSYGLKVAFFYAKLYLRILRPHWAALLPEDALPRSLRLVLDQLDTEIQKLHQEAALAA